MLAAYLQRVMSTMGLLVQSILLTIFASTQFWFWRYRGSVYSEPSLRFLDRFRTRIINLNPMKCQCDLLQVEYVGHVISCKDITISKEKRDVVLSCPLSIRVKELQGFLGLVNNFRDDLPDLSLK